MFNALTDVPGLKVGHWTDRSAATGCTVVLCTRGAVAGVDVQGVAPGTRDIGLLNPLCEVDRVNGIVLAGGAAYGLAAADGVMNWLEKRGVGRDMGVGRIPIVPAASLYDLQLGRADVRPGVTSGYVACDKATGGRFDQGSVGAGTGAAVGKALGATWATKSGLGSASHALNDEVVVAALVVVNAFGAVYDPQRQTLIAGARLSSGGFADTAAGLNNITASQAAGLAGTSTTLAVVATNAALSKGEATQVSQTAQKGFARTIQPIHPSFDGSVIFGLSYGEREARVADVAEVAAQVVAEAVVAAIWAADAIAELPSARTLQTHYRRSILEVASPRLELYEERDAA